MYNINSDFYQITLLGRVFMSYTDLHNIQYYAHTCIYVEFRTANDIIKYSETINKTKFLMES